MENGTENYRRFREEGEESGLAEIIREYKDGLIFYLHGLVGNFRTAEELAEDTFVLLGVKKPRDKGKGSFRTWLYTIARNLAVDSFRRRRKAAKGSMEVSMEECGDLSDEESDLEVRVLREERKILLHRAMRSLKPEYRQILWLCYFENFSMKECAGIMKKSVNATEVLALRARRALKAQLEKEGYIYENL